ncbi:hypothetical protein, partial [Paraburkholderia sp. BR14264]|uniref:hypothetical protein n=1 Tax=Paraburkholderia sp. BR14264 TaxID=3237001 RepID=UPI003979EE91
VNSESSNSSVIRTAIFLLIFLLLAGHAPAVRDTFQPTSLDPERGNASQPAQAGLVKFRRQIKFKRDDAGTQA